MIVVSRRNMNMSVCKKINHSVNVLFKHEQTNEKSRILNFLCRNNLKKKTYYTILIFPCISKKAALKRTFPKLTQFLHDCELSTLFMFYFQFY